MPRQTDERQDSIASELKATERRINAALKDLSAAAGVSYDAIPTEAQNAPDLLWLQKAQHIASALEALTAGQQAAPQAPDPLDASLQAMRPTSKKGG